MHFAIEALLVLAALWFLWRVARMFGRFRQTPEPPDEVGVAEPNRKGPKNSSGGVALEEPDDDEK
jgi:hypothetical protein